MVEIPNFCVILENFHILNPFRPFLGVKRAQKLTFLRLFVFVLIFNKFWMEITNIWVIFKNFHIFIFILLQMQFLVCLSEKSDYSINWQKLYFSVFFRPFLKKINGRVLRSQEVSRLNRWRRCNKWKSRKRWWDRSVQDVAVLTNGEYTAEILDS